MRRERVGFEKALGIDNSLACAEYRHRYSIRILLKTC